MISWYGSWISLMQDQITWILLVASTLLQIYYNRSLNVWNNAHIRLY